METWLTNNDASLISAIVPHGYKFQHLPRNDRRGGGVGVLFKASFHLALSLRKSYATSCVVITLRKNVRHIQVYEIHILNVSRGALTTFSSSYDVSPPYLRKTGVNDFVSRSRIRALVRQLSTLLATAGRSVLVLDRILTCALFPRTPSCTVHLSILCPQYVISSLKNSHFVISALRLQSRRHSRTRRTFADIVQNNLYPRNALQYLVYCSLPDCRCRRDAK